MASNTTMERAMELKTVKIDKPADTNFILGQSHFIKTVEDLYEAIVQTAPHMRFGLGFCESSGPALVRYAGNDVNLIRLAQDNALALACGHAFIIFMENGYPINILNTVKNLAEVCRIFCATANPVEVIVAETDQGRGILGVIDGEKSKGIETDADIKARKDLLRKIGYKL
jgi:adenosine/AMP kinase